MNDTLALSDSIEDSVDESSNDEISLIESLDEEPAVSDACDVSIVESTNDADELGNRFDDIKTDMELYDEFNTNEEKDDYIALIKADDYVDGKVTLLIDNALYYERVFSNYDREVKIYSYDLNLPANLKTGSHNVEFNYQRNGFPLKTMKGNVDFDFSPVLTYLEDISIGETNYIRYTGALGKNGTIDVYNMTENSKGSYIATVTIDNSIATIPIVGTTKGVHKYWFDFNVSGSTRSRTIEFEVHANTQGFAASVSSKTYVGNSATITFAGSYQGNVNIFVDGKVMKTVWYAGSKATENIAGLTLGTHQISVKYERGNYYYSNTFNVSVVKKPDKITLNLNSVKIKKSAKKLVLKATLKINSKAKKGLKVTFQFNGKKFVTKTDSKGVAKATVNKKFYKKLKVGKKVKYQVTYSTNTVKKTAKVKK